MNDDERAALRALAMAATPGPWVAFHKHKYDEWHVSVPISGESMRLALFPDGIPTGDKAEYDAQYIARANPQAVLALLDERDTLAALLLRYRREVPLGHQPHMIAEEVDAALGEPR